MSKPSDKKGREPATSEATSFELVAELAEIKGLLLGVLQRQKSDQAANINALEHISSYILEMENTPPSVMSAKIN